MGAAGRALTSSWNPGDWLWAVQRNTDICWNPTSTKRKKKDLLVTSGIPGEMGSMTGSLHFPHGAPLSPKDPKMESLSPINMGPETKLKPANSTIIVNSGP